MHGSSLTYAWLSDGTKVSARADDGSGNGVVKRYLGSFVYTTSGGYSIDVPTDVESVAWDEGRIFFDIPEAVPEEYIEDPDLDPEPEINPDEPEQIEVWLPYRDCWFAGDHLGNVRTVIDITSDLSAPQILEQSDYLPFGTRISNPNLISGMNNRWRYAGKEEQRFGLAGAFSPAANAPFSGSGSLDLSLLDFGARMYDPFVARWISLDKMSHRIPTCSPYVYCGSDPVDLYDPDGNLPHVVIGALVGAAIEGGIAIYHGKSTSEVAGAMVRGAIEGGVIAATAGVGAGATVAMTTVKGALKQAGKELFKSAVVSAVGSVVDQGISYMSVDATQVLEDTVIGVASGVGGLVLNTGTKKAVKAAQGAIESKYASSEIQDKIRNEIKRDLRNEGQKVSGSTLNKMEKKRVKNRQEAEKAFVRFVGGVVNYSAQKNNNSIVEELHER